MDISILFTVTQEYAWNGDHTELPAAVRKGIITGKGDNAELDCDALTDNLTDEMLSKLIKLRGNTAELNDESVTVDEVGEA